MPFAGCRTCALPDQSAGTSSPLLVFYPSQAPEHPQQLGPYTLDLAPDAPVAGGLYPLVVISHGTGGSHLVYRDLARHLARNGFIVAMPEHPRNNRNNDQLAHTARNLTDRPRHIRLTIDWLVAGGLFGASIEAASVAMVGHSLGAYTALAVAGGIPTAFPHETPDGQERLIEVTPDPRVKALVLLAPASVWYRAPGALSAVQVPILMLTAEQDPHTPPEHARIIQRGIPESTPLEHHIIANAGHFSFLSPFPESMTRPGFAPSQDPPGFDRKRFHADMNDGILGFLQRVLAAR